MLFSFLSFIYPNCAYYSTIKTSRLAGMIHHGLLIIKGFGVSQLDSFHGKKLRRFPENQLTLAKSRDHALRTRSSEHMEGEVLLRLRYAVYDFSKYTEQ